MIKAVVFDAYGTLYDVHSVMQKCEEIYPGKGAAISQIWRQKQLEYTWLRSLMGKYKDFWSLTGDALQYALKEIGLQYDEEITKTILNEYLSLKAYPEAIEALDAFRPRRLMILSNGSPEMLNKLAIHTGINEHLDGILSVDTIKVYKPKPEVYYLAVENLGVNKDEILFVSSNSWDVAGAKSFGFLTAWLKRIDKPFDKLEAEPDLIVSSLKELSERTKNM
jgi:2-haloacid dehalogenase